DARRAWLAVQPEAADAKSLPQVLAAAGPAAAQPMYLTAACTSAWTRGQGFTLLIDHRDELGQIFTRVAQLAPDLDEAGAERELGKLFAALPAYAGGDLRKARSHFEAALERAPDSTRTRIAFARSVAVKAQDRALFEQQLNAAAELPDTMGATEARDLRARQVVARRRWQRGCIRIEQLARAGEIAACLERCRAVQVRRRIPTVRRGGSQHAVDSRRLACRGVHHRSRAQRGCQAGGKRE